MWERCGLLLQIVLSDRLVTMRSGQSTLLLQGLFGGGGETLATEDD